jgi:hypothetical protein
MVVIRHHLEGPSGLVKITHNMCFKFYPDFIPIYGYMVSGVRIQLPGASVLTLKPETFCKSEQK